MIEVVRWRRVAASPERVWQVVSRAAGAAAWLAGCERVDVTSGAGRGERRTLHGRWDGRASEVDQEVVEFRRPAVIAWRHVAERLDGRPAPRLALRTEFRVELAPTGDGGTVVRLRLLQVPVSALRGVLLSAFGRRRAAVAMDASLDRLTDLVGGGDG
ncbi:SRPBCC family protein [Saccharothrix sp. Mg75]|uniref:SRPBCC family protein n=1 Tax=Saccharothrix sp. Mg75 TaxID=3445357 RepID=UPI003EEE3D4D